MNSDDDHASSGSTLAQMLAKVATGDRDAFEDIYRRTSVKLFGVCLRILPVRQEAEEALQEVYLSVWQRAGSFDMARGSAMTWLITLARNRAIDRLRAKGRIMTAPIELADDVPDNAPDATSLIAASQDERRLAHCMSTLDGGDAGLIHHAFFEGLTYADLATRASTPLGTVKSRIRRALLKLRECLS
jgi:RNA polymerase sigma-70 factor (ECF subfamily)